MRRTKTMTAIILAGGTGIHIRALDADVSKPMIPLFDSPLIEHTVKLLAGHGIEDIVIAASSDASRIAEYLGDGSRYGAKLLYFVERSPLGTAGAVKKAAEGISDTFIVVSGDVVTDANLQAAFTAHKSKSALATLLTSVSDEPEEYGVVDIQADGRVGRMVEKPRSAEVFSNEVSAGIYVLQPEALSAIPYSGHSDFAGDVFPRLLANRETVYAFRIDGYWRDVSSLQRCRRVHFDALDGRLKLDLPAREVSAGVWQSERAEISASVELVPPVYIGPGACICSGAVVGPQAIIGAEAMVEKDARVSGSVIGAKSLIAPRSTVENCTIGSGCATSEGEEMRGLTVFEYAGYQPSAARHTAQPRPHVEIRSPITSELTNT